MKEKTKSNALASQIVPPDTEFGPPAGPTPHPRRFCGPSKTPPERSDGSICFARLFI